MQNVPIPGKILTILAVFGLFILVVVGYATGQITKIDSSYSSLISGEMVASQKLARANRAFQSARASIAEMTIARSEVENKAAVDSLKAAQNAIVQNFDMALAALPNELGIEPLKREVLKILTETCKPVIDFAIKSVSDVDVVTSQTMFLSGCQPFFPSLSKKVADFADSVAAKADVGSQLLKVLSQSTIWTTLIAALTGLVIVLVSSFFIIRAWVVTPVRLLSETMGHLAGGDLSTSIRGTDRKDEIGSMAKAVQVFKDSGIKAQALAADAENMRNHAEEERQRKAEADRTRAEQMAQATSGLGEGLRHLADGDLAFQLSEPFATDFETLRSDFNAAVNQLSETLRAVADATGAIDNGSREVSASADDLSKRTEQQAASLEETAAALDQITVNVANSSKRADEARKIAVQANESAAQSGRVVANAVDAMQRIEKSSDQISNIIGVIDEIAFQTNLLALNAGVEAARAGDAGKGFAVVAQEVRELAQRSAQAAKEIKDLIRNSSVEVQSGVKLVSETGEALKTIEEYIVTVNQHMDSIATSAREQSVGLAEVNTAVNQMDQVTQQNAAMVEETSAAGANLANESGRLRELISQFQLGNALRQTAHVMAAGSAHRPVVSPVKRLAGKVMNAFSGNATVKENWEEF